MCLSFGPFAEFVRRDGDERASGKEIREGSARGGVVRGASGAEFNTSELQIGL